MYLKRYFKNPGIEYRSVPFWSWNDRLDEKELHWQMAEMKDKGIGGAFMHSRVGLITPYLSAEWLNLVASCVKKGKEIGFYSWLYDEDRWPSGFAGGLVTERNPSYGMRVLLATEVKRAFVRKDKDIIGLFVIEKGNYRKVSYEEIKSVVQENILIFKDIFSPKSDWFNGGRYIDTMNKKAVKAFINSIYRVYKNKMGKEFGKACPGIFTDELNYYFWGLGGAKKEILFPWTKGFDNLYQKRWGYDLKDFLPSLVLDIGDYYKHRYNYRRLLTELFLKNCSQQVYGWCSQNNLIYTGHYLGEESLISQTKFIGEAMAHYEYMHYPGIDILCEKIEEILTIKQVASIARQFDKPRVLSELYGCGGWDLTFEGQKWIGDWHYALGVNFRCQHLALYSLKGCRKRDYPPSINYQSPWWKYYRVVEDYFARLSFILSQGKRLADTLVIHPVESVWASLSPNDGKEARKYDNYFYKLTKWLLYLHYDFDFGSESILDKYGRVEGKRFIVNKARYKLIIVPPSLTLRKKTLALLKKFYRSGGPIIFMKPSYRLIEGRRGFNNLPKENGIINFNYEELAYNLAKNLNPRIFIKDQNGRNCKEIICQERKIGDKRIYFLVNTSRNMQKKLKIKLPICGKVEEWYPVDGVIEKVAFAKEKGGTVIKRDIYPAGSILLVVKNSQEINPVREKKISKTIVLGRLIGVKQNEGNAFPLDFCHYRIGKRPWSKKMPVWKAGQEISKLFNLPDPTSNSGVQFWKYYQEKGIEKVLGKIFLRFLFTIKEDLSKNNINLVLEKPNRYNVKLNGCNIDTICKGWWIDKSFSLVDTGNTLRTGENEIILIADLKRDLEIENMYLYGDFEVDSKTMFLKRKTKKLTLGDWTKQGFPFYSGSMEYQYEFLLKRLDSMKYYLDIPNFKGTCLGVKVNNILVGVIGWKPYRLEITSILKEGVNNIEIEIVGSRRNILGPLHLKERPIFTGPDEFSDLKRWTNTYNLVPYGLLSHPRLYIEFSLPYD